MSDDSKSLPEVERISYRSLLTDLSTGTCTILAVSLASFDNNQLELLLEKLSKKELALGVGILFVVLSIPLGVFVSSAAMWLMSPFVFLLEWVISMISRVPALGFIVSSFAYRRYMSTSAIGKIPAFKYFSKTRMSISRMLARNDQAYRYFSHLESIIIFSRNLSLVCLLGSIACLFQVCHNEKMCIPFAIVFMISLINTSQLAFVVSMKALDEDIIAEWIASPSVGSEPTSSK